MALRSPEGAALLVAGFGVASAPAPDASAVHTLAQIGEVLLATGAAWQIRRLTAAMGERYAADRPTLKQHLDELAAEPVRSAVVVLLGVIVEVDGAPALVTGAQAREYPEDATLPLAWIRERLLSARAEQLVVVMSARGEGDPEAWLGALGTEREQHVIAVDAPPSLADGDPVIDALLTGLCGDALDPRTGTITMASLSEHVAQHVPSVAMQPSTMSETLAQPPPLAGFWDVRRSQLAQRSQRAPGEPEDLTGTVLPGRFRIDAVLARGTFGTVYRARQLSVGRDVAVKVLHADIDPASEDGRLFVQEIRSVGRIDHTSVVRIYQADITHDGRLFFAMELLDGRDLQQLGGRDPMPRERAVELVRQLLAGLGAAHDAGLVHADVKPANAIVVPATRGSGRIPVARGSASMAVPPAAGDGDVAAGDDDGGRPAERLVLVDFGLARLRERDRPAESAGGTPAYMAPEQLHEGRVDARSDLYSAALVLVFLLTGWRRMNVNVLSPPLDDLPDPALRAVLARALDPDPARRYQSARALSAALLGRTSSSTAIPASPIAPFRLLAPFTEADRGRFHGREADLALLTEHVLFGRSVIYTAPSGIGKTSLLRAGLVPRLEALGIRAIYQACRGQPIPALAAAIAPGSSSIGEAIETWRGQHDRRLVLVLDQIEAALGDPELLPSVLAFDRWPAGADVTVVLSVREDYLARLVGSMQELERGAPILRLPPLGRASARAAIIGPLAECRIAIEPELLDVLLDDLQRAAAALAPEMAIGGGPVVYPPHLQLACSVLVEHLGPGEATLTLAHYRRLGGFEEIVAERLERVLDTELAEGRDAIARDLFGALVTAAHERAICPEAELVAMVGAKHGAGPVTEVLEALRSRGMLVRVRGTDGPAWELVHDCLIPRVVAWVNARDLARRRATELVRHHLRRCRPGAPSLLDRAELREVLAQPAAIAELAQEWASRDDNGRWTPARLVARSRQVLRRRAAMLASTVVAAVVGCLGILHSCAQSQRDAEERELALLNIGEISLVIEAFDWDSKTQEATRAPTPPGWQWDLREQISPDADRPFAGKLFVRGGPRRVGAAATEDIDVRGGPAHLIVERPGCAPSVVPLQLPGYNPAHERRVMRLRIPTCVASQEDMMQIPAGPFIYGGFGEPAVPERLRSEYKLPAEAEVDEPAFSIDRTEVTNAAFAVFAEMASFTEIKQRQYPNKTTYIGNAGERRHPVTTLSWTEARDYCRFLGKDLPTSRQWTKALRGSPTLLNGNRNEVPRRNLPWGAPRTPVPARIKPSVGAAAVRTSLADFSPWGLYDLVGNVAEWTRTQSEPGVHVVRGGDWEQTDEANLLAVMAAETPRPDNTQSYALGARCASVP
jgi:formylglycine-generating enzyme required for sulfatase activity